jgi:hypothetical protein
MTLHSHTLIPTPSKDMSAAVGWACALGSKRTKSSEPPFARAAKLPIPFRDLPATPTHCHLDIAPRLLVPSSLMSRRFYYMFETIFSDPPYHFIFLHFLPTSIGLTWCHAHPHVPSLVSLTHFLLYVRFIDASPASSNGHQRPLIVCIEVSVRRSFDHYVLLFSFIP